MALQGVSIGGASGGGKALSGVDIGAKATPLAAVVKPIATGVDTTLKSPIADFTGLISPGKPADTSNVFAKFFPDHAPKAPAISTMSGSTPAMLSQEIDNNPYGVPSKMLENTKGSVLSADHSTFVQKASNAIRSFFQDDPDRDVSVKISQKVIVDKNLFDIGTQLGLDKQFPLNPQQDPTTAKYYQQKQVADYVRQNYDKIRGSLEDPSALPKYPEELGPTFKDMNANLDQYLKEAGVRSTPTNMEIAQTVLLLPVAGALIEAPIVAGIGLAAFTAIGAAEHYFLGDSIAGKVADSLGANQGTRDVLNLAELFAEGKALHMLWVKAPAVAERFTKQIVVKYRPGTTVTIEGAKIKDLFQTNKLMSAEEKQLYGDLYAATGRTPTQLKADIANGVTIDIAPEKILQLVDRPYWSKIKDAFNTVQRATGQPELQPTFKTLSSEKGAPVKAPERRPNFLLNEGISKTQKAADALIAETKNAISEHGEPATHQALMFNLGLDSKDADALISKAGQPDEVPGVDVKFGGTIEGVNPKQFGKLAPEQVEPLAKTAAARYQKQVLDPRAAAGEPTVIGADDLKDHFGKDYNDLNHPIYSKAAFLTFEKALATNTNKNVVLTGGGPASGKTELVVNALKGKGFKGTVYDSNLSNYDNAVKQIAQIRAAGKHVEIHGVLPNVDKARTYSIQRENEKGRGISDTTFARGHAGFPNVVLKLMEDGHIDPKDVHILDTRNITSFEQALEKVFTDDYIQDPLAELRTLGYNEEDFKQTYAKDNYDSTTGERQKPIRGGSGSRDALAQDRANQGDALADANAAVLEEPTKAEKAVGAPPYQSYNRGFVAPGEIAKDIGEKATEIKTFLEETNQKVDISADTSDDLYKLETNSKRDIELAIRMIKKLNLSAEDSEAIYHYEEDKGIKLTKDQQAIYDQVIKPLGDQSTALFNKIKDSGTPLENENYTPRNVKGKGSVLDRLTSAVKDRARSVSAGQGGILSKSSPSFKNRTMKALVDSRGRRIVVSVKGGEVTAFINKKPVSMGKLKAKVSPKVREFFDPAVRAKLEKLATDLGITHERHATGRTEGLGGRRAGVSFQGENLIKTRLGPDSALAHELGHQIDHKYGMQQVMKEEKYDAEHKKQVLAEMRALADKRFDGLDVTDNFKKYVREGTEKMAVMFEAYISNRDLFKEVAPHLYDDFRDFLASKPELKQFLDIKGSVQLGSTMHGGEHLAGKIGATFKAKNGNSYTVAEATTKEIEANTNLTYHKDVLANRTLQYLKLRQIDRAVQFLESFRTQAEEVGLFVKQGEEAPANYRSTVMPQFRGYVMEPRLAEQFDNLANKMTSADGLLATLGPINRFLRNAIFFNPLIHVPNLTVHWLVNRGATKFLTPAGYLEGIKAFGKAWDAVVNHSDDYLVALEHGAPLLASEANSHTLGKVLLENMAKELEERPAVARNVARALGYTNPVNMIKAVYRFSNKFTWTINDLFTMQAVYEDMSLHGLTLDEAITETGKHIPSYRIPNRIFDKALTMTTGEKIGGNVAHGIADMMRNPNLSMFGAYHYGALRSYGELTKSLLRPGASARERAYSVDKIAMMALIGLVLYPFVLDKFAQRLTGNDNAKFRRAGSTTFPENIYELLTGQKDAGQVFQSVVTPAPIAKLVPELVFNIDLWTMTKIYGPGGEGFLTFMADQLAPIQQGSRLVDGVTRPVDFFASLGGISSPKSTSSEKMVLSMLYDEKPKLQKDLKAHVANGDQAGAYEMAAEFNRRLEKEIKAALIDNGKSGSDEQVAAIWEKQAVRMPGDVAMANYTATKGLSYVDKLFSDGKPKIVTGQAIESDSLIHTVMVYAHAITADPTTAFNDIFKGQVIRKVENGTIIVYRMSITDSQAVKAAQGGDNPTMKLDHTLPLQLGGTNEEANLKLVPTDQWAAYTPVEDYLGTALRDGRVDKATAQKLILDFKSGIVTFDDIKAQIK